MIIHVTRNRIEVQRALNIYNQWFVFSALFSLFFQKKNNISATGVHRGVCHKTKMLSIFKYVQALRFPSINTDHGARYWMCSDCPAAKNSFSCNLFTPISSCPTEVCCVIWAAIHTKILPLYIHKFTCIYFVKHVLSLMCKQFYEETRMKTPSPGELGNNPFFCSHPLNVRNASIQFHSEKVQSSFYISL